MDVEDIIGLAVVVAGLATFRFASTLETFLRKALFPESATEGTDLLLGTSVNTKE